MQETAHMGIVSLEGIVAFFPLKQKRGWGSFYKNAKGGNYAKRKCKTKEVIYFTNCKFN